MFTARWRVFLSVTIFFILLAWGKFQYYPNFAGTGKLIIKDNRNSQLQFLILETTSVGIDKNYNSSIKEIDESSKADALLNSHAFFNYLAKNTSDLFLKNKEISNDEIAVDLESKIKISFLKNNVVLFEVKTESRKLTTDLLNITLRSARNFLIENELNDLSLAESYFESELKDVKSRLSLIENKTLKIFRNVDSIYLQMDSPEGIKYQKDLYEDINQMNVSLNENKKKMLELKERETIMPKNDVGLNKFSSENILVNLDHQNQSLEEKIGDFEKIYRRIEERKTNSIPVKYEIERLKVNHEFEYKLYSSLVEKLSIFGLQKLYVQGKIQVLEFDNFLRVKNTPSLKILILISLSLSFTLSFFGIYFYELFKPNQN